MNEYESLSAHQAMAILHGNQYWVRSGFKPRVWKGPLDIEHVLCVQCIEQIDVDDDFVLAECPKTRDGNNSMAVPVHLRCYKGETQ